MKNNKTVIFLCFIGCCFGLWFANTFFYVLGEHTGSWLLGALGCNFTGIILWEAVGKVLEK